MQLRNGVLLAFVVSDSYLVEMREGVGFVQLLFLMLVVCLWNREGAESVWLGYVRDVQVQDLVVRRIGRDSFDLR